MYNKKMGKEFIPRGWRKDTWQKVEKIIERISKEELLDFYRTTGAIRADALEQWSREELINVVDEIGEKNARQFLEIFKHYLSK